MARVASGPLSGSSGSEIPSSGEPTLEVGDVVFIVDGPQVRNGVPNWLLTTERTPGVLGWFRAIDASGKRSLAPFNPECPDATTSLAPNDLNSLGRLQSLACFGPLDITLKGVVECYDGSSDGGLGGAWFTSTSRFCYMGEDFPILGNAVTDLLATPGTTYPPEGLYTVIGHFDDPASAGCGFYEFATSIVRNIGDPSPVLECRKQFVATKVDAVN